VLKGRNLSNIDELILAEGWTTVKENGVEFIIAYGKRFPKTHPVAIHLKLYRLEKNPDIKYLHMKAAHDYLWPNTVWHYWTERRFKQHCKGWKCITYAGGASTTKSFDAAKIGLLFWLANPSHRTLVVASTSLESLSSRIWGYLTKFLREMAIKMPVQYIGGQSPKVITKTLKDSSGNAIKDTIHGCFAISAKQGDDEKVVSSWIGRHPDEAMMVILDESTDMPPALIKVIPNLEQGVEFFQLMGIGNSLSKFDLHGALSTPKDGWNSVDPMKDTMWETTQKDGVCLFFSCYESPAIFETDPVRKEKLSKFLITSEAIKEKENVYSKDSDMFWRFVLGFWRTDSGDDIVVSKQFIEEFKVFNRTEWSGLWPLHTVGGLDMAFSTGGDQCILRLAVLGVATSGQICLDYRDEELLFRIPITANSLKSADLQVADQVLKILAQYNCALEDLAVDATGQGRAMGEVLHLRARTLRSPIKIYSTQIGNKSVRSFDVVIKSSHELWFAFREFIQHGQIKGLDHTTAMQLTTRKVVIKNGKPVLESKKDYKTRMGAVAPSLAHSPDEADCCALALQAAIINYGFTPGQRRQDERLQGFEHDKYWVFNQIRKVEEAKEQQVRSAPPIATFEGDMGDIKWPLN
jgi:hypothetical protein